MLFSLGNTSALDLVLIIHTVHHIRTDNGSIVTKQQLSCSKQLTQYDLRDTQQFAHNRYAVGVE